MLHILIGDARTAKQRAATLVKDRETVRFGEGGEPFQNVLGYLGARGMFSPNVALVLDDPLASEEGKTLVHEHAKELMLADALVVLLVGGLDAATKKAIPKGALVESFDDAAEPDEPPQSTFALADAFASGDRKQAWVLYRKFIEGGAAPEELHGILAWQARALVLAANAKSAADSGLKPFVYSKSKRAAERLGPERAEALSRELVALYHDARAGKGTLEDLLEMFLLKKA